MTNAAVLRVPFQNNQAAVDYMGPATVTRVDGPRIVAKRSDGLEVEVELALALPYEPAQGDVLLLVGGREGNYAFGVIHGRGKASFAIEGDIDLHAVGGELRLTGDQGIVMHSPAVEIVSDKMKVFADSAVHKVTSLYQHVRELWSMKAEKAHIAVSDEIHQRSRSATVLTEEVMSFNGKQIHLG